MTRQQTSQTAIRAAGTRPAPTETTSGAASLKRPSGLTIRQKACLDFIRGYMAASGGIAPSYEEIARALGLRSKSGVHRILGTLIARGHITKRDNHARSLQLAEPGGAHPLPQDIYAEAAARADGFNMTVADFLAHAVRNAGPPRMERGR